MKALILALLLVLNYTNLFSQDPLSAIDQRAIKEVLQMQEESWNKGNIEKFMEGYWNSDRTVFTGAAGPIFGWQEVMNRYIKSYPDRAAMGKTKLEIIDLYKIKKNVALMIGKYQLQRIGGDLEGYFTLVWKKLENRWLIISDHTTVVNE